MQKENPERMKIGLTIVTPVYNREDCIRRCVDSVIAQNYPNLEHWIVDDGSTDDTYAVLQDYASKYPWIRCHRFTKNRGVNAARNYGIKGATKEYLLFLDSDDYLVGDALNTIDDKIYSNQGYRHYLFAQDDCIVHYNRHPLLQQDKIVLNFDDFLTERVANLDFAHVMATDLIQEFPFDENLRIYEDLNFYRIYKKGERQLFLKTVLTVIERNRVDSVTKESRLNNSDALTKQYVVLKQKLHFLMEDYPRLQVKEALSNKIKRVFILGTALAKYDENRQLCILAKKYEVHIPLVYRIIDSLRLGSVLKEMIFFYSRMKNR